VNSDRGWQNSHLALEEGKIYKFTAAGKTELANVMVPWISEPNGITIRYHHGKPLGLLLAAIGGEQPKKPDAAAIDAKNLAEEPKWQQAIDAKKKQFAPKTLVQFNDPEEIGTGATFTAPRSGTLFFKVNDSAAELSDNRGAYEVTVEEVK
jgi:hypothetical protein